jgi:hypothetical protein
MLHEQDFETSLREREHALVTTVTQAYNHLWFPSSAGQLVSHEIRTAGGEGGAPVIETIRSTLRDAGELLTPDKATTQETLISLATLFFEVGQTPTLEVLLQRFASDRRWPVQEEAMLLEQIVRAGAVQGHWCLFRMGGAERTEPEHCFSRESGDLPLDLDLSASGWSLVRVQGATQRGWIGTTTVDPGRVARWVAEAIAENEATYVSTVVQRVVEHHGEVPQSTILEAVDVLVQAYRAVTYRGLPDQHERPRELIHGTSAILHSVQPTDGSWPRLWRPRVGGSRHHATNSSWRGATGHSNWSPCCPGSAAYICGGHTRPLRPLTWLIWTSQGVGVSD